MLIRQFFKGIDGLLKMSAKKIGHADLEHRQFYPFIFWEKMDKPLVFVYSRKIIFG